MRPGAPYLDSEMWDGTTSNLSAPPVNESDSADYVRFLLAAV